MIVAIKPLWCQSQAKIKMMDSNSGRKELTATMSSDHSADWLHLPEPLSKACKRKALLNLGNKEENGAPEGLSRFRVSE